MKRYAIIVAGGSGQRMESEIPKQFLKINNDVILMKSISAFSKYDSTIKIIVALPEDQIDFWKKLCIESNFLVNHKIVKGGKTRYHSVKNALKEVGQDGIVAIHDGVRPLVSQSTLDNVFEIASINGNAVPYIDVVDSIRKVESDINIPVDRNKYKLIQTPQTFDCRIIHRAYMQEWEESFTDDANVVEKLNIKINLVPGNRENIKITTQVDLIIANSLSDHLSA